MGRVWVESALSTSSYEFQQKFFLVTTDKHAMKLSIVSLTPLSAVEHDLMMSGTTISSFVILGHAGLFLV
jgi:hypothetical protein